jgi:hypothetical protein
MSLLGLMDMHVGKANFPTILNSNGGTGYIREIGYIQEIGNF